jgi:hypothetical protein
MDKLRIVMLGTMGRAPFGGHVWVHLNWLRGFQRLGHDIWYVEDDSTWPYDPERNAVSDDCSYAVRRIAEWSNAIGLAGRTAFRLADRPNACWGLSPSELKELYRSCDLLINMAGATPLSHEQRATSTRVLLHTDPVAPEIRIASGDEKTKSIFGDHDYIVTCGENIGRPDCPVPVNGLEAKYRTIRQAVDLDLWPMVSEAPACSFTTVGNWRQSGNEVEYNGERYTWSKHYEWLKFVELPQRSKHRFDVALNVADSEDRDMLESFGWRVLPALPMSYDVLGDYRKFIQHSWAAWTVCKDQNIRLRSGWFSDREATYLASGKPVIMQNTGFSDNLPTGKGLFAFSTMEDILTAIDEISSDYHAHAAAAREIAVEYFEARRMATRLLDSIGLG